MTDISLPAKTPDLTMLAAAYKMDEASKRKRAEKLQRCLVSAQRQTREFLDDPERVAGHNAYVDKLIEQLDKTGMSSEAVKRIQKLKLLPKNIEDYKNNDFTAEIHPDVFIAQAGLQDNIKFNPNAIDHFSDAELQKIFIHEFNHRFLQNHGFFKMLGDSKKISYLEEHVCDGLSDGVKAWPRMAHIQMKINEFEHKQKNPKYNFADAQLAFASKKKELTVDGDSHPAPLKRVENSHALSDQLAARRMDDYLDRFGPHRPQPENAEPSKIPETVQTEPLVTAAHPIPEKSLWQKFVENAEYIGNKIDALYEQYIAPHTSPRNVTDEFNLNAFEALSADIPRRKRALACKSQ